MFIYDVLQRASKKAPDRSGAMRSAVEIKTSSPAAGSIGGV
jgi:hypothetical protein